MSVPADKPVVVLVNLGTPDAPTPAKVRAYLREFLTDPRVIEYPALLWRPILEGIILRVRPRKVAHAYQTIWTDAGSPLMAESVKQAELMQTALGDGVEVRLAMCYGSRNIKDVLSELMEAGRRRIVILPAYPQYAASTVGAIFDQVSQWVQRNRDLPELRWVRSYPTAPDYIEALAVALENHWAQYGRPDFAAGDKLVASYHSIPMAMHKAGDPYREECEAGAAALAARLNIPEGGLQVTYQSVFGPAEWIGPATIDTISELGKRGTKRLDVICPGFVADCLETLEEIAIQNREAYEANGGVGFHYVPWANASAGCVQMLVAQVQKSLSGWV